MRAVVEKSNIIIKVKIVEKHCGLYLAETESPNLLTFTKEELKYESWKKNNNVCIDLKPGKNYIWISENNISYFINDLIMKTE